MSNKAVPTIYRSIISSVIESVRSDFDEVGVEEAVLQELLRSWEEKVAHSRVADFSHDPRIGSEAAKFPPVPTQQAVNTAAALNVSHFGEVDGRNLEVKLTHVGYLDGQGASNGTKSKKDDGDNKAKAKKEADDGDEINSDLDDSEEEVDGEDDEAAAESGDLIIALYEKVQRTKNKWKVTLKDGLVSVGGKEYLFAKCQGPPSPPEEGEVSDQPSHPSTSTFPPSGIQPSGIHRNFPPPSTPVRQSPTPGPIKPANSFNVKGASSSSLPARPASNSIPSAAIPPKRDKISFGLNVKNAAATASSAGSHGRSSAVSQSNGRSASSAALEAPKVAGTGSFRAQQTSPPAPKAAPLHPSPSAPISLSISSSLPPPPAGLPPRPQTSPAIQSKPDADLPAPPPPRTEKTTQEREVNSVDVSEEKRKSYVPSGSDWTSDKVHGEVKEKEREKERSSKDSHYASKDDRRGHGDDHEERRRSPSDRDEKEKDRNRRDDRQYHSSTSRQYQYEDDRDRKHSSRSHRDYHSAGGRRRSRSRSRDGKLSRSPPRAPAPSNRSYQGSSNGGHGRRDDNRSYGSRGGDYRDRERDDEDSRRRAHRRESTSQLDTEHRTQPSSSSGHKHGSSRPREDDPKDDREPKRTKRDDRERTQTPPRKHKLSPKPPCKSSEKSETLSQRYAPQEDPGKKTVRLVERSRSPLSASEGDRTPEGKPPTPPRPPPQASTNGPYESYRPNQDSRSRGYGSRPRSPSPRKDSKGLSDNRRNDFHHGDTSRRDTYQPSRGKSREEGDLPYGPPSAKKDEGRSQVLLKPDDGLNYGLSAADALAEEQRKKHLASHFGPPPPLIQPSAALPQGRSAVVIKAALNQPKAAPKLAPRSLLEYG